jgi:hypothetical protein
MLAWAQDNRVAFHCARKANQNGFCESFNGRMHGELLNESLFIDLARSIGAGNSAEASSVDIMGTYRWARVDVGAYQHQHRNK